MIVVDLMEIKSRIWVEHLVVYIEEERQWLIYASRHASGGQRCIRQRTSLVLVGRQFLSLMELADWTTGGWWMNGVGRLRTTELMKLADWPTQTSALTTTSKTCECDDSGRAIEDANVNEAR